jgi:hypothetical protein
VKGKMNLFKIPFSSQENRADKIRVSALKKVCILYKGDIYHLARLLLEIDDAKNKGTNIRSRYTIKGLAAKFAMLSRMDYKDVEKVLLQHGLPFGAMVEYDKDVK